jgi:aspartyl-tRNA(Asn)/glutamyl-tRNA(Gln) amidotransferase subunit A
MTTPISATTLLEQSLAAIAEHGARTNAFILVDEAGARAADDERRRGIDRGPFARASRSKTLSMSGQPTTAASKIRVGHVAQQMPRSLNGSARRQSSDRKDHLHEFALGTTSEESAFGAVHNPATSLSRWSAADRRRSPSGWGSVGPDRTPAARSEFRGGVAWGLKPSLGEVPTDGVVSLSATFDHVGPITRSVADAATLWAVLTGREIRPIEPLPPRDVTLGALGDYFTAMLESGVRSTFEEAVARLRSSGVGVVQRTVSETDVIVDTYVNISLAEAAHWHAATLDSRAEDYQPPVRERLERGRRFPLWIICARDMRGFSQAPSIHTAGCSALFADAARRRAGARRR